MNQRAFVLWLACAAQALALHLPAAAQGLRAAPPPGRPSGRAPGGQRPALGRLHRGGGQLRADHQQRGAQPDGRASSSSWRSRASACRRAPQLARAGAGAPDHRKGAAAAARARPASRSTRRWWTRPSRTWPGRTRSTWRSCAAGCGRRHRRWPQFREDLRNQIAAHAPARARAGVTREGQRPRHRPVPARAAAGEQRPCAARRSTWPTSWWPCPRTPARRRSRSLRAKAQRVLERARAGEDFAKLARGISDAAGRRRQRRRGRPAHRRPLSAAVRARRSQNLPEGGVSDIVALGRRLPRAQGAREAQGRLDRRAWCRAVRATSCCAPARS